MGFHGQLTTALSVRSGKTIWDDGSAVWGARQLVRYAWPMTPPCHVPCGWAIGHAGRRCVAAHGSCRPTDQEERAGTPDRAPRREGGRGATTDERVSRRRPVRSPPRLASCTRPADRWPSTPDTPSSPTPPPPRREDWDASRLGGRLPAQFCCPWPSRQCRGWSRREPRGGGGVAAVAGWAAAELRGRWSRRQPPVGAAPKEGGKVGWGGRGGSSAAVPAGPPWCGVSAALRGGDAART